MMPDPSFRPSSPSETGPQSTRRSVLGEIFAAYGRRLSVPADETLMSRGVEPQRLLFVVDGQVLMHSTSHEGRDTAYKIALSGDVVGLTALSTTRISMFDATAIVPCDLLTVERALLQRLVFENPAAAQELFDRSIELLHSTTSFADSLAAQTLKARLARWIVTRIQDDGIPLEPGAVLPVHLSQRLIAAFAGVSRETINRQLKTWAADGVISLSGRTLRVLRPDQLLVIGKYIKNPRCD